ncbi:hypothetical protein J6590_024641 [Homalodisca vitripennis]|nr:hypothetical protein J6590_024641 [Homalodisca vitripennis]
MNQKIGIFSVITHLTQKCLECHLKEYAHDFPYFTGSCVSLIVATDASPVGLGVVLSHRHKNRKERPTFASRSITSREPRYRQIYKEASERLLLETKRFMSNCQTWDVRKVERTRARAVVVLVMYGADCRDSVTGESRLPPPVQHDLRLSAVIACQPVMSCKASPVFAPMIYQDAFLLCQAIPGIARYKHKPRHLQSDRQIFTCTTPKPVSSRTVWAHTGVDVPVTGLSGWSLGTFTGSGTDKSKLQFLHRSELVQSQQNICDLICDLISTGHIRRDSLRGTHNTAYAILSAISSASVTSAATASGARARNFWSIHNTKNALLSAISSSQHNICDLICDLISTHQIRDDSIITTHNTTYATLSAISSATVTSAATASEARAHPAPRRHSLHVTTGRRGEIRLATPTGILTQPSVASRRFPTL